MPESAMLTLGPASGHHRSRSGGSAVTSAPHSVVSRSAGTHSSTDAQRPGLNCAG